MNKQKPKKQTNKKNDHISISNHISLDSPHDETRDSS